MSKQKFLHIDADDLIDSLKQAVVEVLFEKADGTPRLMKATLQKDYIKNNLTEEDMQRNADEAVGQSDVPVKVVHVWDLQQNAWRSIPLNRVMSCQLTNS